MRVNGGFEFVDSYLQEVLNTRLLARTQNGSRFVIGLASNIESPADVNGMVVRATTANVAVAIALGAETVMMAWGDIYSALERGVIDGACGSIREFTDNSLGGIVQTLIVPGLFTSDASLVISEHIWNRLDDMQKEALMAASLEWEQASLEYNQQMWNEAIATLESEGTRILELTGAERDEYIANAYATAWGIVYGNAPEITERLRGFTNT
jgi:TRAP-type C4-dicarboxylate transport system substrate-binding protein